MESVRIAEKRGLSPPPDPLARATAFPVAAVRRLDELFDKWTHAMRPFWNRVTVIVERFQVFGEFQGNAATHGTRQQRDHLNTVRTQCVALRERLPGLSARL